MKDDQLRLPPRGVNCWDVFGLPFSSHQSSCSMLQPKMFSWEQIHGDVELWVDVAIEQGLITPKRRDKKYAWLCESRSIVPFFSKLYSLDEEGNMFVNGITPILRDMIDEYDGIFTCDKDLVKLHDKIHFCFAGSTLPWTYKEHMEVNEKRHFCSFVASCKNMCKGHALRHELYELIKGLGEPSEDNPNPPVHCMGSITGRPFDWEPGCHQKNYQGNRGGWHCKSQSLKYFPYSIVMENDRYPSYFTEKITDCFATGTVPIYWGAPDIGDYFDMKGIIQVNSVDEIMDTIFKVWDNNIHQPESGYAIMNKMDYLMRLEAIRNNYHKTLFLESPDDMLYRRISELGSNK